ARPPTPPPRPASGPPSPRPSTGKPPSPPGFEAERRRRELLHELYRRLPESERTALDQRAEALAREELGPVDAPLRLRLLAVDKRNELLGARPDAPSAAISGAREPETNHRESQIPDSGSVRDET